MGLVQLRGADEEGKASAGGNQAGGYGENASETLDGAEGDQVEACLIETLLVDACAPGGSVAGRIRNGVVRKKLFGATGEYIDVHQCKGADDFAEEGALLMFGLDQGEGEVGRPEFDGDAGESGAGAEVGCSDTSGAKAPVSSVCLTRP